MLKKGKPVAAGRKDIKGKLKYSQVKDWIWMYFDDTIKIFVPRQFKNSFQTFLKNNKHLKVRQCATYKSEISKSTIKTNPDFYKFQDGKDYIANSTDIKQFQNWLKGVIKEYNDETISVLDTKKTA